MGPIGIYPTDLELPLVPCNHIITRVTEFIMSLAPNIIRYPTLEEKEETASYFLREKGFPYVIGTVSTFLFMFC